MIGGGPAGLFLARLLRKSDPTTVVDVYERNLSDDAHGLGIVLSDRAMSFLRVADPETHDLIRAACGAWSDLEIRLPNETVRYGGYGFTAVSRPALLRLLRDQASLAGVQTHFGSPARIGAFTGNVATEPDVIVVADGARSRNRRSLSAHLGTTVEPGKARYIWFGTTMPFGALTHAFVLTKYGPFVGHAHPYGTRSVSFVVQTDEATWSAAGMDTASANLRQGETDEYARKLLSEIFAEHLGGEQLLGQASQWRRFPIVRNDRWSVGNIVLLGDAAHTAHFSVGLGTRTAMEDAVALAAALRDSTTVAAAFADYESVRRPEVDRIQDWSVRSMRWWETFGKRLGMTPRQFALHFITRTGSLSYAGLRRRHAARIDEAEAAFAAEHGGIGKEGSPGHASGTPLRLGPIRLHNRVATILHGDLEEQLGSAAAFAAAGGSLILADWRGMPRAGDAEVLPRWSAVARAISGFGGVFGVLVGSTAVTDGTQTAASAGARLVEVVLGPEADGEIDVRDLVRRHEHVALCAGLSQPPGDAWSTGVDDLVVRCHELRSHGVSAVHLHGDWERVVDVADRIRAETALPVIADGPDGWALRGPRTGEKDDHATRLHLALVSGRIDLVAGWPLARSTSRPRPRTTVRS